MLASSEKNNDVMCLTCEITTVAAERGKHTAEQKLENPDGRGQIFLKQSRVVVWTRVAVGKGLRNGQMQIGVTDVSISWWVKHAVKAKGSVEDDPKVPWPEPLIERNCLYSAGEENGWKGFGKGEGKSDQHGGVFVLWRCRVGSGPARGVHSYSLNF